MMMGLGTPVTPVKLAQAYATLDQPPLVSYGFGFDVIGAHVFDQRPGH